jgi:glycosyltransferase involved in cell wall biosynthesis
VGDPVELSIVMPCLNEARTLPVCIEKARGFLRAHGIVGEVVVADNGSTDGSPEIAKRLGARVVHVTKRGYGSALDGGIRAARGRFVVMGDADDSYDFSALEPFVRELRAGGDVVMGNRFRGGVLPGAMPPLHRWLGNPVLSGIGRLFFRTGVGDFHCGLRGFTRAAYDKLDLHTEGMEFATEMVVKAKLKGFRLVEVPIVLHPDGRDRPPHLRSWRDGWRHLRFMLLFSPRWLFMIPGAILLTLGLLTSLLLLLAPLWTPDGFLHVGQARLDIHTLLVAGLACLVGYQLIVFALFTKVFAITEGLHPPDPTYERLFRYLRLETGIVIGLLMAAVGAAGLVWAFTSWGEAGFGGVDPRIGMRRVIPAAVLVTLGVQTIFSSFFLSILGLERR